jgi:monovalent cation:H+ antiporter-2, CPA2 family
MENTGLLVNLVVALTAALVGAIIAIRLRQSPILGFILAGIAIGPFTPGFVGDSQTVQALAEIGIILLMFAIGVQFSIGDLLASGRVAIVGATLQVGLIIGIGFGTGLLLGWDPMPALFFGAVISNSSSTVLSRVLGERGQLDSSYGRIALAWSSVQDLWTVVLIVVLSSLSAGGEGLFRTLLIDVGTAGIFLLLLIPIGIRVLPWLFTQIATLRNREVFVLAVGVVALGLAYSASLFGLSLALGAFVAGIVVAESDLSHQILGDILPLRDIFAGLFFVSVGMLVDPMFVIANIPLVLLTVFLVVVVKGGVVAGLAALLGARTRTAIIAGAILGQSAEFSFLLAQLGTAVGVVDQDLFSLILGGAAMTIVLAPGVVGAGVPFANAVQARRSAAALEPDAPDVTPPADVGHAVICGSGRVGRVIRRALTGRVEFVVIEEDPRVVQTLRRKGVRVIQGDASTPAVLGRAGLDHARVLFVAIANPITARQIVSHAQQRHPDVPIIVRTHSEAERRYFSEQGVEEVVLGEHELALEMARHGLAIAGVAADDVDSTIVHLRRNPVPNPLE